MYTISSIVEDVSRGCVANNLNEGYFSYRIIFFVNEKGNGTKHYTDASYDNLRKSLENIIKKNLTTSNTVVVSAVTTLKDGKCISLLSRAYGYNLNDYFQKLCGEKEKKYVSNNYGRMRANWC